jgi:hypothetical protein
MLRITAVSEYEQLKITEEISKMKLLFITITLKFYKQQRNYK